MKKYVKVILDCLFEIFVWFLFLEISLLAILYTYIFPKQGIVALISAVTLTFIPKIYNKFIKSKEE